MVRVWLSLLRFSWLLLLLSVWLLVRLLLVMLFVSRKFLILLLVRKQRSLIRILCLFLVSVIRLMLTRQNIIVNQKRLADYEQCRYLCKNKQDFCDNLSPGQVIGFADLCHSLELELCQRQVDYYSVGLVGSKSPYWVSPGDNFPEDESSCSSYYSECDFDSLSFRFEPVYLELPYE